MSVIYILLPLALLVAGGFVLAFIWAARRGQFDDLETPAMRILDDDSFVKPVLPKRGNQNRYQDHNDDRSDAPTDDGDRR